MALSELIELKTPQEIETMKRGAQIALSIISEVKHQVRVGMSTAAIDFLIGALIQKNQCTPAFLNYQPNQTQPPFPSNACLCTNSEVFHAPGSLTKILQKGDLLTIDLGLVYGGLYADVAETLLLGDSSAKKLHLIDTCRQAINAALPYCVPGLGTKAITRAIEQTIKKAGLHAVPSFGGHSIGSALHMNPYISNTMNQAEDCELVEGMILCLEPACSLYPEATKIQSDGWTASLSPNNLSAHHEREVLITLGGGKILE